MNFYRNSLKQYIFWKIFKKAYLGVSPGNFADILLRVSTHVASGIASGIPQEMLLKDLAKK